MIDSALILFFPAECCLIFDGKKRHCIDYYLKATADPSGVTVSTLPIGTKL